MNDGQIIVDAGENNVTLALKTPIYILIVRHLSMLNKPRIQYGNLGDRQNGNQGGNPDDKRGRM